MSLSLICDRFDENLPDDDADYCDSPSFGLSVGVTCDMMNWPVLLKSVSRLGNNEQQGAFIWFL